MPEEAEQNIIASRIKMILVCMAILIVLVVSLVAGLLLALAGGGTTTTVPSRNGNSGGSSTLADASISTNPTRQPSTSSSSSGATNTPSPPPVTLSLRPSVGPFRLPSEHPVSPPPSQTPTSGPPTSQPRSSPPTYHPTTEAPLSTSPTTSWPTTTTSSYPSHQPTISPTYASRLTRLQELLIGISLDEGMALFIDDSPQNQAMLWLAETDWEGVPLDRVVQRFAMVCLFSSTDVWTWRNHSRWLTDANECSWFGCRCTEEGLVSELLLQENNLQGTVPSEVWLLTNLSKFI
jgi:hypothetical protein